MSLPGPESAQRCWELERFNPPWKDALLAAVVAGFWLWIEGALAVPTILAATNPFDFGWQINGWPTSCRAIPLVTLFGLPLVGWTAAGVWTVIEALPDIRGYVVTTGPHGIRVERRTRRRRLLRADLDWSEILDVEVLPFLVVLVTEGNRRVEVPIASQVALGEIAGVVREHIASEPVRGRLPVVPEWTAYLDDHGPTLIKNRSERRVLARVSGTVAALGWVNSAALATGLDEGSGWWWLTGAVGAATMALTYATYRLARFTPRWTATPGAVVRIDNRGTDVVFAARSLEHVSGLYEDGEEYHALEAVSTTDGGAEAKRRRIFSTGRDPRPVAEAGRWLAPAAEIPFRGYQPSEKP